MSVPRARLWLVVLMSAALAACASSPHRPAPIEAPEDRVPLAPPASRETAFEKEQRARALDASRRDMLADAALAWEVLTVLRPDVEEYHERLAETRRKIDSAVAERLPLAQQAAQHGDTDVASRQFLEVLALQPDNQAAAEALRALEQERNKHNYLGKYSRLTIPHTPAADSEMPPSAGEMAGRNEVEHASLLANEGELDDAIALLERHLASDRHDAAARHLLARIYYRKAESLLPRDRPAAVAALKKSAQLDSSVPDAAQRLKQLQDGASPPGPSAPADH